LPSTDESALSDLVENPEIGKLLVSIRQWKKLKDKCEEIKTYTYKDNHVHSDLKQGGARTSRMSSGSPALQNIANWKEDQPWTWIRDAFVPEEDYEWLLADYSQIEMRVLAHYSRDENMVKAFMTGLDLHKITAQNMFGTEDVNKQQRSFGKVMNFTISYGGGKRRICDSLRFGSAQCDPVPITDARRALVTLVSYVTDEQLVDPYPALAAELYNLYRKNFPAVLSLKSDVELTARSRGYIVNAYGREIPVPREETHKGLNYLIQSSAADLMKQAMNRTWTVCLTYARDNDLVPWKDIALFMSIHDELIWKIPIGHSVALANAIRPTLEEWPRFRVPIAVDFAQVAQGDSWATKKGLKL
jgi:DNA polymerase-1